MIIALAQLAPLAGEVQHNVLAHQRMVKRAVEHRATLVVFPELSITGYEPTLAQQLAFVPQDPRLSPLQAQTDELHTTIAVGVPLRLESGLYIGMLMLKPNSPPQVYTKRYLHPDERRFFDEGLVSELLRLPNECIAPAICYEISVPQHAEAAHQQRATTYMASVAKSSTGLTSAYDRLEQIARLYQINVAMVNAVGPNDDFVSAGQSAVWSPAGRLLAHLDSQQQGLLVVDTLRQTTEIVDID